MKNQKQSPKIEAPNREERILFHCCCAPCSGGIITLLEESGIRPTVLFFNPNIQPEAEYNLRKQTLTKFLTRKNIPFIDSDYDPQPWFDLMQGMENEPQRGKRCFECFKMRLEYSARLAKERGFNVLSSSFGISRWKDMDQVNSAGNEAAREHGIIYWDYNWRRKGGQDLMRRVTREQNFYQQTYCGCKYSRRISTENL
ncbi:MAG: epoxyqueuosine reductase QueH [Candidatus Omnitrophota bacterium]